MVASGTYEKFKPWAALPSKSTAVICPTDALAVPEGCLLTDIYCLQQPKTVVHLTWIHRGLEIPGLRVGEEGDPVVKMNEAGPHRQR